MNPNPFAWRPYKKSKRGGMHTGRAPCEDEMKAEGRVMLL